MPSVVSQKKEKEFYFQNEWNIGNFINVNNYLLKEQVVIPEIPMIYSNDQIIFEDFKIYVFFGSIDEKDKMLSENLKNRNICQIAFREINPEIENQEIFDSIKIDLNIKKIFFLKIRLQHTNKNRIEEENCELNPLSFNFENDVNSKEKEEFLNLKFKKMKLEENLKSNWKIMKDKSLQINHTKYLFYEKLVENFFSLKKKKIHRKAGIFYSVEFSESKKYHILNIWSTFQNLSFLKLSFLENKKEFKLE